MKKIINIVRECGIEIKSKDEFIESIGYLEFKGIDEDDTDFSNAFLTTNEFQMFDECKKEDATHFYIIVNGDEKGEYRGNYISELHTKLGNPIWITGEDSGGIWCEEIFIFEI